MNRRNLVVGALASVAAIAAVAWIGEITGKIPIIPVRRQPPIVIVTPPPIPPDPDDKPNTDDAKPKPKDPVVAPVQDDIPRPIPPIDRFTVPVEPPRPVTDFRDATVIPLDRGDLTQGDQLFRLSDLDKAPIPKYQASPSYPYGLRQDGITGDVLVEFTVDPKGDVRNAVAVQSSRREFEDAACTAVGKWKFRPGWKNGHPVFTRMQVPIVFRLDQGT